MKKFIFISVLIFLLSTSVPVFAAGNAQGIAPWRIHAHHCIAALQAAQVSQQTTDQNYCTEHHQYNCPYHTQATAQNYCTEHKQYDCPYHSTQQSVETVTPSGHHSGHGHHH